MTDTSHYEQIARQLAIDSIRASTAAGSGHPTSSLSAAHLVAVLVAGHLRVDLDDPKDPGNDRLVLSKGHASPLLYATFKALGLVSDDDLLGFRRFGSPLQGHPVPLPATPLVDVATGSLGQGLPVGLGMALAARLDGLDTRIWVVMGDSESLEGSVWEAMANASHLRLDNLVAIVDVNRLGQRGPTMLGWDTDAYVRRAEAFGWEAIVVDGHDVTAIDAAYTHAAGASRPTMIVARTVKGHGVSFLADQEGWHGKALSRAEAECAIEELGGTRDVRVVPHAPSRRSREQSQRAEYRLPVHTDAVATRKAAGDALAALAQARDDVVVLDAEVGNSTHTEEVLKTTPERFVELFIAEQAMVGAAVGLQAFGKVPFASTFAAFLSRAQDFVRMAAISRADIALIGSHAGVSIGEDGPSQMALEDLAAMRAVHGSTVLYPADARATVSLVPAMAELSGVSYMRTTREATPALYRPDEEFPIGGSKTLRQSDSDRATVVAAGVTVYEALRAATELSAHGIAIRVIDAYSIKPIDAQSVRRALAETRILVVVEDHWREGGLGDAVLDAVAAGGELQGRVIKLAVSDMPGSGSPGELRDAAGISAPHIVSSIRAALAQVTRGKPRLNSLQSITGHGQSIWFDDLRRSLLKSGELERLVEEDFVTGVTTNPTILAKAISESADYDEELHKLFGARAGVLDAYREVVTSDIRAACDVLAGAWERARGGDGFVSVEVSPDVAHDADATVAEVRDWVKRVDRPNLLVKVPATDAGAAAFEDLTAEGVSVNVTLIFSLARYRDIAERYIAGIERFVAAGGDPSKVHSVASFFVSRVDTEVDARLDALGSSSARRLRGKAGIANARVAYGIFRELFAGERWWSLAGRGATLQRPLWASTGVKDPAYEDTMYVDELVAPDTVNTMPLATLRAVADHGSPRRGQSDDDVSKARVTLDELAAVGIDYDDVIATIEREGLEKFTTSFNEMTSLLNEKRQQATSSRTTWRFGRRGFGPY